MITDEELMAMKKRCKAMIWRTSPLDLLSINACADLTSLIAEVKRLRKENKILAELLQDAKSFVVAGLGPDWDAVTNHKARQWLLRAEKEKAK